MQSEIVVVGSLNLDLVASVARIPLTGETVSSSSFSRHVGGKGANQAVAAALAGGHVHMIGRHGSDGLETLLLETLRSKGVEISGITRADCESGLAFIAVGQDGQNSIVIVPGANGHLCPADIAGSQERLAAARLILAQLETPLDSLERTMAIAREASVPVMLDPAPARPLDPALLGQITYLTPNETEAAALAGAPVPRDPAGLRAFAETLLAAGPENLLLKLGGQGVYIASADGVRELVPAYEVEAVDTTAAGDAFNGALAVALAEGADLIEAARFATAAAALAVTRPGAIPSLATRSEIESFRSATHVR
jgi:ribokinase